MRWPCISVVAAIIVARFCYCPDIGRAQEISQPLVVFAADADSVRVASKKKSPTGAMLRSLILPGWGQFYNGQYLKGVLAAGAETGFITAAIYWNQRQVRETNLDNQLLYKDYRNQMIWWLGGTILLSMLDAYVDAHLSDFDESPDLSLAPPNSFASSSPALKIQFKIKL